MMTSELATKPSAPFTSAGHVGQIYDTLYTVGLEEMGNAESAQEFAEEGLLFLYGALLDHISSARLLRKEEKREGND